jgi:hypothetical protein
MGAKPADVHDGGVSRYPKEPDMPNGIYPIPPFNSHPSHATNSRPSLLLRLLTSLKRPGLDHELARGADPEASDELALRATQLRSPDVRARLANKLVEALGEARRPNLEPFTAGGRRQRAAVEASRDDILALVRRLRDEQPVDVRGAAMTAQLVNAGIGRRKQDGVEGVRHAVRAARFALDATAPGNHAMAAAA